MIDSFLRGFGDPFMMVVMMIIGMWIAFASGKKYTKAPKLHSGYLFASIVGSAFFFSGFWNLVKLWLHWLMRPC